MKKKQEANRRSLLNHVLVGTAAVNRVAASSWSATAQSASHPRPFDENLYHESENFKKYCQTLRS